MIEGKLGSSLLQDDDSVAVEGIFLFCYLI